MENKSSMSRAERLRREKVTRYSIRKYSFGAASVAVAALFMFLGNGAVSVQAAEVQGTQVTGKTDTQLEQDESKPATEVAPALNKTQLESYISEIETKLANGSYANKTDESVAVLKADLEAAKVALVNATTQDQITKAYNKLVNTANAGLRNKPVEKKETPAVDTTNGKETVGKKAANTEKKSDTNSIENTGSNDTRNGKALDKNNAFRAETTETQDNFTYSMEYSTGKEIYLYNEEDADVNITVSSTAGNITKATVKAGSGQFVLKSKSDQAIAYAKGKGGSMPPEEEVEIDGYGWSYHQTLTETQGPVTIKITGKPNDTFKGLTSYTKTEDQRAVLGARYLQLADSTGAKLSGGSKPSAPGYFNLVVKSQTYKYDIKLPESNADKIAVSNVDSLTEADIAKIKNEIKIQYSDTATTQDARLASKKGEVLQDKSTVVATDGITVADGTVTVTYKDGSVDTTPVASVARTNEKPTVEIPFSLDGKKDVFVYANEDFEIPIKFKDDTGKVASATVKRDGNQDSPVKDASNPDVLDNQYNTTVEKISTETVATAENPAIVKIKGNISKDNSGIAASAFPKEPNQELTIVTRYATATDTDGAFIDNTAKGNTYATDPGAFTIKLKAQTAKYDIKSLEGADKVAVSDANNVTDTEFAKIKEKVKIAYASEEKNPDKNIPTAIRGTDVENQSDRIASITKDGNNVVVTYKDGSIDKKPLTDFARTNLAPTVELPYSNADKRQIYVYTGENTDLTFTGKDDITVKNLYLRNKGLDESDNASGYGFTIGKVTDSAVASGEGTVSDDKKTATIKMVGVTNLKAGQKWTSFIEAKDNDGVKSMPANESYSVENYELRRRKPGYVEFIVKSQTDKYDIKTPTEKVVVTDPANVTEADLAKVREKLQLEYKQDNDDANIAKDTAVDKNGKIQSVTKDGNNFVVTYTDGSKDTRPLSEFVTLDKQPAIDEVNKAAEKQIEAINNNPEATQEEKDEAIKKVNADKAKALDEIAKPEVTTKDALDKAQNAGTDAIAADNPVVAKKDAAKADVEAARKAKEDAIKADTNLTQAEKDAAIAKNNTAAAEATKAIDTATTNDAVDQAKTAGTTAIGKVNPVAKENAKEAIANALTAKNNEIDGRKDLSQAEKDAAKAEAKKLADAQLAEIAKQPDNADTPEAAAAAQKLVDNAEDKGVGDVTSVNPVAKEAAKKAVADELTKKEEQIDARTDLTTEEKAAAKEEAKAKAKEATDAIDAQPSITDSADKATAAQTAVDAAKDKGVADVKAVDPVAAKKPAAKQAIDDALTAKNNEIDARTDLTPEEKTKAKEIAKAKADAAKDAVDKATTNAEVGKAKTDGTTAVANVTPVAKEAAKTAIADALTAKNKEIDARTDLTDEEKTAAKKEAKDKADAQLAEIAKQPDAADTPEAAKTAQDAVDAAKKTGVADVTAVNPAAVKKTEAKQAIDDALTAKNNAIDARTDLTDAEKTAAKDKAAEEAKKAKEAIDAATTDAAVDTAKTAGLDEVAKVNPVAKDAAKKAVADELAKKEAEIDARTDLSDAEKVAAKKDAQAKAKEATDAINAQPDNAETPESATAAQTAVDNAKDKGVADVKSVNPVAKEAAKKAVADELAKKEAEIDARTDLTKEEKDAAKKDAQDKAKSATDAINAQPDNADTPEKAAEAQKAVDTAKKTGVDEVAAVNPEAVTKPAAKKAIDDKLAEQLKAIENTPDATDEEKKVAADAAKALAEEAKKAIDKAGTDAEVKQLQDEAKKEIEKSVPVVEDKPNARKAIDDEATAKKAAIDARDDLTPKAKEDLKAQVDKIAEQAKKSVDAAKTAEAVNGIEESDKAAIKAVGEVNIPADKVLVNDPSALTDAEKAKVLEAVKKVNLDAKEITQDADGNITVTTPDGHQEIITPEQVVKTADTANDPKAGNDVVKPADKVVVNDPAKLTDAEKEKIKAAVEAVNPNSVVTVDEKGNAKVSTPDGQTQVIPVEELVRTVEDTKKPNAGNDIVKPADKTVVANPDALTPEEKKAIEDKVKAVNPGSTVVVDDKGNATVTTPEGKTAVIPATDLTKSAEDAAKPNAGNDIVKPADKTVVANPDALTQEEKKAIEDKVKAVNPGSTVVVDDKGNATVTTPAGKTAVIPSTDLVKSPEDATKPNAGNDIVKPADKTVVANPDKLTDAEKTAIEDKVKAVNPGSTVVVDDKGNATVTTPAGKTAVIPASDLTKSAADAAKPNAGNDIVKPADKTVVANPDALTPEEKKAIEDKVKAVNPGSTVVVDDEGNATVTTPEGKTAVIPASDLTKSAADAAKPNAGNDIVKPADKTVVANPDKLTDAEKKAIEDKVKAVNSGSTVVVDDKGNATVTTLAGKTAVIPASDLTKSAADAAKPNAGNDIVKPADKTVVANPDKLTDTEKKAIEDKVKAVNPGSTVVVDDKGNATVTIPAGKTAVIPSTDLTKSEADAAKPNAGNDIVKPADKTVVANPDALTPEEKKAIEDKVKAVNPGSTVVVDDKGNATVTTPAGKTAVIPSTDLTKSSSDAAKPNAGNDIVKPADKTVVANPDALTPEEKKAIEDKVKAVNPGSTVVVDDKGNATVTTPAGKTAVIPATDLVKSPEDATKPNAGNDIVKPADKIVVANPDALTQEEKKAIEDKVKAVNPGSTVVVDDKGNATVTTPEGKTAVIPSTDLTKSAADEAKPNAGDDIVKPADKTVVANPDKLTDAEKKAIEDKVKAVNPDATVVVDDKGNTTVTTPAGKTAVIPATDLTKSAADAAKPNAGDDIVKPADKTVVANPDKLTDAEKKAIEDKVKAVNPGATVVVDDKGNATVTTPAGKTAVIPSTDLTKSAADEAKPNAGNAVNTPASKVEVKDPANLTDAEKKAIEDKVKAVNPGSKVVVDDKGNATVTTPADKTAVIPETDLTKSAADAGKANAGNAVNTPASKVEVKDPANLTDTEKKAIEDKVKAVNPGSKVVVDDKGNATVTTSEGKTATIPAADLTKSAADAGKENAGNGANTPATKTVVKDPANLTDEEKGKVKKAVEDVNPGSTVVVNDKGDVIVTKGDGTVLVIPELDLVIPEDKLTDPTQQNGVNTPATRVLVGDKAKLTADEIEKVKESVKAVNPGATVVVDDKGNATVTTPEGKTATIPAAQLVKDAKDVAAKNNGDNINLDFEKETVVDFNNLTDAEKEAAKAKIKGANADVEEVIFDKAGNATVITKDGKVYTIVAKDIFKQRPYVPSNGGGNNGATNTDAKVDKAKLEGAIRQLDELIIKESAKLDAATAKEATALLVEAKDVFANTKASQAGVDAMVKRIEDFMAKVASATNHATPANDQDAQTPTTTQAAANANQTASAQANTRTVAKELPNTGTADSTVAMVAAAASALLGLGLAGRRRKEDEEA